MVIVMAMTAALSSCTINYSENPPVKETNAKINETEAKETKPQKVTFALNETAVFDNLKFTVTELKESNGGDTFFKPESGNVFVGIKFTIENISKESQNVSSMLLFDGYVNDVKCSYSFSANGAFDVGILDGTIAPGKKLVGYYSLEVPADWSNIELNVQQSWLSNNIATFVFEK